jgi:HSP20 family protein
LVVGLQAIAPAVPGPATAERGGAVPAVLESDSARQRRRFMALELWRPRTGALRRPFSDVADMFGRFFEDWGAWPRAGQARGWMPALDMFDRENELVLRADLPGLEQKDVEVRVESGVLTIRGERRAEEETKEDDYYCCERWAGSFARSVSLPPGVDVDNIEATFRNGVLEVHIPKSAQAAGRKIEIKAA